MNTQSTQFPTAKQSDKKYFRGFRHDVDSDDDDDGLTEQRLEQWRPFSQNPFVSSDLGLASESNLPQILVTNVGGDAERVPDKPESSCSSTDLSQHQFVSPPSTITHAGPTWVNLFYDLAWTASFASLTQNNQFNEPWETVSYIAFFLVVWWLWASQTLYSIHFYTNDWVHLLSIFVQLIIFGLLAATTRGYDVTAYIRHSPGISTLDPKTMEEMVDPERYRADRVADYSLKVIAVSLALSRTLLWAQHLLVLWHARRTARKQKLLVPRKLYILPIGLTISNVLYWAAMRVIFSDEGKTVRGATFKFIFWGAGLVSEVLLHLLMEHTSWRPANSGEPVQGPTNAHTASQDHQSPPEVSNASSEMPSPTPPQQSRFLPEPLSNVNLRDRLEGITTGINGIAGTLYAVISAPGLGGPVAVNIACAATIVYFLAYFYFEGPTGRRDPKGSKVRRMVWMLLHFPFMLSIILLLLGVKNQFLLTSYLSTAGKTFQEFGKVMDAQELYLDDPGSAQNMPIKNFLLKRGLVWAQEFEQLSKLVTDDGSIPLESVDNDKFLLDVDVWNYRISLKIMVKLYETFMGGSEKIAPEIQTMIDEYNTNYTLPLQDINELHTLASSYHYETILTKLLEANLLGARYITGLAAVILISLSFMNRVHSKPRDRFQWGIIFTRFAMGFVLLLLLLLNIGRYQSLWVYEGQENQQAGVFLWIWSWWVLPTITLAFVAEFVLEAMLLRCAGLAIARKRGRVSGPLWRLFLGKSL
ncbi:unnamed protein product [Rhizoctonia solani]|uniref:Uncharacterized protein n=1 Tax=Rhizoctonia solani TaxID=456999 RepID=A0A8H3A9W6_9AGAM|nr:unnamed protein product [Rhizoctonia solani]